MRAVLSILAAIAAATGALAAFDMYPGVVTTVDIDFPPADPNTPAPPQSMVVAAAQGVSTAHASADICTQMKRVDLSRWDAQAFISDCERIISRVLSLERGRASALDPTFYALRNTLETDLINQKGVAAPLVRGGINETPPKANYLQKLLRENPSFNTVCEAGFFAGQTALAALTAKPGVRYFAFENDEPAHDFLDARYPDQLVLYLGETALTLPRFITANSDVKCDVMVIDGRTPDYVIRTSLVDFKQLANPAGHVIMLNAAPDEAMAKAARQAWTASVVHKDIEQVALIDGTSEFQVSLAGAVLDDPADSIDQLVVGVYKGLVDTAAVGAQG